MSGKRVLALYAAVLLGFAVVLCRLYFLAENHTYAARAEAQSTVRLSLPARRGSFYDHSGLLLTGLETRYLALCFPGENNYPRLYAFTDSAGQALLYRNRNRSAPFLLEVDRDLSGRGIRCFATARRCAEVPLCQHLIGYLDAEGRGIAGLEKALDTMRRAVQAMDEAGYGECILCPETMGKVNQLGTLDEVLALCSVDERMIPCVDFGHLYARSQGTELNDETAPADYAAILDAIAAALPGERAKKFHAHFSRIAYTKGGEKCHLTFADTEFGPPPAPLMQLLKTRGLAPTIICESAGTQAEDAAALKKLYEQG